MTERQEYFKQYYQNNKDKYKTSLSKPKKNKDINKFKIIKKKTIITFD